MDHKQTTPRQPRLAPMDRAVLDLLQEKETLTAMEAQGVLRCRSLSRRIATLRQCGARIISEHCKDITGQRYVRYRYEGLA